MCYVFVLYTGSEPLLPDYMDVDEGPHEQNKEVLSEGAKLDNVPESIDEYYGPQPKYDYTRKGIPLLDSIIELS